MPGSPKRPGYFFGHTLNGARLLALACLLAVAGCGGSNPGSNPVAPSPPLPSPGPLVPMSPGRVAIISIDGLRPDAIIAAGASSILALAERGAYSWHAQTILPSTTLPSHISMLSGYTPDVHGMTWDDYIKSRGPIPVPTLFSIARGLGRGTAMIAGKHKFTYFCDTGACDRWAISVSGDDDVTARALGDRADLLFVHLPDVDLTGHVHGWMSDSYLAAVRRADAAVGRIVASLPTDMTVILSADHGGQLHDHGSSHPLDMTIPWIMVGPRTVRGRYLSSDIRTVDTAATAAYVLGIPLAPGATGRPVLEAFVSE